MSVGYRAVGWNRNKRVYDVLLLGGVALYLALFAGLSVSLHPEPTAETTILRATGSAALLLLHVILSIGPLCRLSPRFLPLLYNRRHMGVTMFALALGHGALALLQYHSQGDTNPFVSVLLSETRWEFPTNVPFQPFGLLALTILFLMAATSHDFWLSNLGAPVWKALHMLVYVAWAALVAHVAFGVLQDEVSEGLPLVLGAGAVWLLGLHLYAGLSEREADRPTERPTGGPTAGPTEGAVEGTTRGMVDACAVDSILEGRARIVTIGGERVAIFRWDDKVAAISNACQHQNGPLGEGRILDGCITCPWHGYQYRPEDGASPPPFTETVPTFRVEVAEGRVLIDPTPSPPGTPQQPAPAGGNAGGNGRGNGRGKGASHA